MKKLFLQLLTGLFITALLLLGMKLYFSPAAIHKRSVKRASKALIQTDIKDLKDISDEEIIREYGLDQSMLLVNKSHILPDNFSADLSFYKDTDVLMNSSVIDDYKRLSESVKKKTGEDLYVMSSYRGFEDQKRVYEEEGPDTAALPGTSEHQTGLALDVYVYQYAGAGFINSEAGRYVNSDCKDFGFIIRYPYGQEAYTGFSYEPWHIRYVGFPHSKLIGENNIVFEDYGELFEEGVYYEYDGYLISKMPAGNVKIPDGSDGIRFSEDGLGHIFVTIKKAER